MFGELRQFIADKKCSTPIGNGTVVSPDCNSVSPNPFCRNTERTRKKIATPGKNVMVIADPSGKFPLVIRATYNNRLCSRFAHAF